MLWRPPPRRRPLPSDFLKPSRPVLSSRVPCGPLWQHEVKQDGYRLLARRDGERVRLWSRHATAYHDAFTLIRDALSKLPADAVLDGEAVVQRDAPLTSTRSGPIKRASEPC